LKNASFGTSNVKDNRNSNGSYFLRDLQPIEGAPHSGGGGATNIMQSNDLGYLITNENDMEILADYEEEKQRTGHF
jgi:hypothetical protein